MRVHLRIVTLSVNPLIAKNAMSGAPGHHLSRKETRHPDKQHQADFFCGKLNGITFPYSSGGIHFFAFFLKLSGTKNSMIFAINHPTSKNKTEAKKF